MSDTPVVKDILSKLTSEELGELLSIVKEKEKNFKPSPKKTRWSKKDIEFLKGIYPKYGIQYCSDALGRSYSSINKKVKELNLSHEPFPSEDPDIFRQNKSNGKLIKQKERKNLFLDFIPSKKEAVDLQKDVLIDKLLSKNCKPSDRDRSSNTIDIKCSSCGTFSKVNTAIVGDVDRFKCNKCQTRGK